MESAEWVHLATLADHHFPEECSLHPSQEPFFRVLDKIGAVIDEAFSLALPTELWGALKCLHSDSVLQMIVPIPSQGVFVYLSSQFLQQPARHPQLIGSIRKLVQHTLPFAYPFPPNNDVFFPNHSYPPKCYDTLSDVMNSMIPSFCLFSSYPLSSQFACQIMPPKM